MSYPPPQPPGPPPSSRKAPPENKPSLLLSREENQCVFDILGKGRQTLATAVVQLLVPTPDQRQWQRKETGCVCFVRDQTKKSYFIQVLSLRTKTMVFRQEIYSQFEYQMPQEFFLTFEGDNSMVGINFADITEASNFREALDNKLEAKRQRRNDTSSESDDDQEERRSRHLEYQNQAQNHTNNNSHHVVPPTTAPPLSNGGNQQSWGYRNLSKFNNKNKGRKDKDKKKVLRKEDISNPTDFRHVQHVGWDPDKGYDLDGVDKDLQSFFEKVGVSANDLNDTETRRFIYKFLESHGGVEILRNTTTSMDISSTGHGPPPPPPPGPNASNHSIPQAPPVPARHPSISTSSSASNKPAPPPPPQLSRPIPPPPPPHRTAINPNHHSPSQPNRTANNPPVPVFQNSQINNGPVPPPPPPPPPPPSIQPPPFQTSSASYGDDTDSGISDSGRMTTASGNGDERSALMKQIQGGIQLKKVTQEEQQSKKPAGNSDFLKEIEKGVGLKPIPQDTRPPLSMDTVDGLAGALARALKDRARVINPSDSESSDEEPDEFDDDEWG